jgi:O-antigen/teichoic acid export membrane protein
VSQSERGSAFSGARWSMAGRGTQRTIRFLVQIVLARVLAPADFGLMAVAVTVMGILDQIRDLGTGQAIIQKKEVTQRLLSSLFWMNVLTGLSSALVLVLAAPLIASVFKTPPVTDILRVMGIGFGVYSWSITQRALLTRKLDFRRLATSDLIGSVTNATVGIVLALLGFGVWALAIGYVAAGIAGTIALWALAGWRPSFQFSRADLREIRGFSVNLTVYNVANNLLTNADNLIISRFLGADALGIYSMGRRLVVFPIRSLGAIIAGVLLPALSRVQDDIPRLQRDYLRAAAGFSLIALPIAAGIAIVAGPLVEVVIGHRWLAAKPVVELLAPTMMILVTTSNIGSIYRATGRTDWLLYWGIGSGLVNVTGYLIGAQWGLTGVVTGFFVSTVILVYWAHAIPLRLIGLTVTDFVRSQAPFLAGVALMAAATLATRLVLESLALHAAVVLAACVVVGVAVYGAVVWRLAPGALDDVTRMVGGARLRAMVARAR